MLDLELEDSGHIWKQRLPGCYEQDVIVQECVSMSCVHCLALIRHHDNAVWYNHQVILSPYLPIVKCSFLSVIITWVIDEQRLSGC